MPTALLQLRKVVVPLGSAWYFICRGGCFTQNIKCNIVIPCPQVKQKLIIKRLLQLALHKRNKIGDLL